MRLVRWLLEPKPPWWRQTLLYLPVAVIPSVGLVAAIVVAMLALDIDPEPFSRDSASLAASGVVGLVVLAPLAETALLAGVLRLLLVASKRTSFVAAVSAVLWATLHGTLGLLAFFGTVWSFFVFSCAYLAWRQVSFVRAFAAALVPHILVNAIVFSPLFLGVESPNPSIERTSSTTLRVLPAAAHVER